MVDGALAGTPAGADGDASRVRSRPLERVLKIGILLILASGAVLRSYVGTRLAGFTYDEPWHIVAGADYVRTGSFLLNPEHPPLVKLVAGAALPATFHLPAPGPLVEKVQERKYVERVMFLQNGGLALQGRVRAALWTFHAALLLGLALLLWRAFGFAWAVGTTTFLAIDPTVGAYMPIAMTDLALGLTIAGAAVAAGLLASNWQWRWVAITGFWMGLALGSKHSALPALAAIGLMTAGFALASIRRRGWRTAASRLARAVLAGLLAFVVLWGMYGFRFHAGRDGSDGFNREISAKIADVQSSHWRSVLGMMDSARLLPRAYIWGLADTVRAGVEGRGQSLHTVWGKEYAGRPPLHTWPSFIVLKLPLASIAMILCGIVLLRRAQLPVAGRRTLVIVAAAAAFHLLALMTARASYAGVRHALPVVMALAIVAGALLSVAWQRRSRLLLAGGALLVAVSLVMTISEPRIIGYHNELAGGSANAYRYFANEGLGMGQAFPEIRAFYEAVVKPTGKPMYLNYWLIEEELQAAKVNVRRRVESLHDTNLEGVYDGFFVYHMAYTLRWPGSDPAEIFKGLTMVRRFGEVAVWRGRQVLPRARASAMYNTVVEYIYEKNGTDWKLVAAKLEEVVAKWPQFQGPALELGNAYLRLGEREQAIRSYRRTLEQKEVPLEELVRRQIETHIAKLESGADLSTIPPLRNPYLE